MNRRTSVSLVAAMIALVSFPLQATAQVFTFPGQTSPTGVTMAGTTILFGIVLPATATTQGGIASRPVTAPGWTLHTPLTGTDFFDATAGITGVTPNSATWGAQVFLVATVSGTRRLYRYSVSDSTGAGTFSVVSGTGTVPSDFGRIAVGWSDTTKSIWVASASSKGVLSVCEIKTATATSCAWSSVIGATGRNLDGFSPIAIDSNAGDLDVYTVTGSASSLGAGVVQRYRALSHVWATIGRPPGSNGGADTTHIQVVTRSGVTDVFVAGRTTDPKVDSLQIARLNGTWSWARLDTGTGAPGGIAPSANNISASLDGTTELVWAVDANRLLWECQIGATPSCTWTAAGSPADLPAGRAPLTGAMWSVASDIFPLGQMPPPDAPPPMDFETPYHVVYLYWYAQSQALLGNRYWINFLEPSDYATPLPNITPPISVAEYSSDEIFGTVVVAGYALSTLTTRTPHTVVWRSDYDGHSWQPPSSPFGNDFGDSNVVLDGAGQEFVTSTKDDGRDGGSANALFINQWVQSSRTWLVPGGRMLPFTDGFMDRGWLSSSHTQGGWLYLNWSDGSVPSGGRFAYRNPGLSSNCDPTDPGSCWCPGSEPFRRSQSGCTANSYIGGCFTSVDGDGTIWASIGDDEECNIVPPPGYPGFGINYDVYPPTPETHSIGVHRITNSLSGPACVTPSVTPAECLYFIKPASRQLSQIAGMQRNIGATFSASQDQPGALAITIRSVRDVNSGTNGMPLPCSSTSTHCRTDAFVVYRDPNALPSARWCGNTCVANPTLETMRILNDEDSIAGGEQRDHVHPSVVLLDYGNIAATWLADMSYTGHPPLPVAREDYDFRSAIFEAGTGPLPRPDASFPWIRGVFDLTGWWEPFALAGQYTNAYELLDIDTNVNARLHVHFFNPFVETAAQTVGSSDAPTVPYQRIDSFNKHR